MNELRAQLAQPFEPKHITWKPGATTKDKGKCMAMAYADLRVYQDRLDELMGLDWSVRYTFWGNNRIACELTLYICDALGRREGITRTSTGEMEAQDEKNGMGGTVAEAQAFKRACAMFGMGRYLYDLPSVWVEFDAAKGRITEAGQKELDARYIQWYNRQASTKPHNGREVAYGTNTPVAPTNGHSDAPVPSTAMTDVISKWHNRTEAEMWAVSIKACENEFEAKKSMDKIIKQHGGVTKENYLAIYEDYYRHQMEKLAAAEVEFVKAA
jgi:hypothetical protein